MRGAYVCNQYIYPAAYRPYWIMAAAGFQKLNDMTKSGPTVGAACAWRTQERWTVPRFHLGNNKEVFDAETFAVYQALSAFDQRQGTVGGTRSLSTLPPPLPE